MHKRVETKDKLLSISCRSAFHTTYHWMHSTFEEVVDPDAPRLCNSGKKNKRAGNIRKNMRHDPEALFSRDCVDKATTLQTSKA